MNMEIIAECYLMLIFNVIISVIFAGGLKWGNKNDERHENVGPENERPKKQDRKMEDKCN